MTAHDTSNLIVLNPIPFTEDSDTFLSAIDCDPASDFADEALDLFRSGASIAVPKAVYRVCYLDSKSDECVCVAGVELRSRIMRVNLQNTDRLFPFIATCGTEMDEWADGVTDPLHRFWADALREYVLRGAFNAFTSHLKTHTNPGPTAVMNPGSIADWPIQEQVNVFRLLGNGPEMIGVSLTDSFLMIPTKSLSGVIVPTEKDYVNCKLCPRENCSGRHAPYDPHFYQENYK
jgi:hypothetical protein